MVRVGGGLRRNIGNNSVLNHEGEQMDITQATCKLCTRVMQVNVLNAERESKKSKRSRHFRHLTLH